MKGAGGKVLGVSDTLLLNHFHPSAAGNTKQGHDIIQPTAVGHFSKVFIYFCCCCLFGGVMENTRNGKSRIVGI